MRKVISLALMFLFVGSICFAQVKNYKVEATDDIPSNKSQDEIVSSLIERLTKQAIEKSDIKIKDYKLSKKEYNQFVKDVAKVEVKNKKVFMKKGNQTAVNIKLVLEMDPDVAKNYLDELQSEKDAKKQEELIEDTKEKDKIEKPEEEKNEKAEPVVSAIAEEEPVKEELTKKSKKDKKAEKKAKKEADKKAKADKKAEKKAKKEVQNGTTAAASAVNVSTANVTSDAETIGVVVVDTATVKAEKTANNVEVKEIVIKEEKMSVEQALQEIEAIKNEIRPELDNLDSSLKKGGNKAKLAQTLVSTMQPKIDKLNSLQAEKAYDENSEKAKILSLGSINTDKKYFEIKILYNAEQSVVSALKYDFSDMEIEKAKEIYKTPKKFVIKPLFSIEENMKTSALNKALTAFTIKHADVEGEKIVDLSKKVLPFKEVARFEAYKNIAKQNQAKKK
ncbi:hypothetical protein [Candidatus Ruminimicrobiellum ovillum]|uniref:hypothetical protein n=1 Tax=Candidatus Ruminimicrobiellum ovillum TaxID=1947927 RepID=UPI003559E7DE